MKFIIYSTCVAFLLTLVACEKKSSANKAQAEDSPQAIILTPRLNQEWHYRVTLEAYALVKMPLLPKEAVILREKNEAGFDVLTYRERRIFVGRENLPPYQNVFAFNIMIGGELARREFSVINGSEYATVGIQHCRPVRDPVVFKEPVVLFNEQHRGGEILEVEMGIKGTDHTVYRKFKTIGHEEVEIPLNTYQAIHVQTSGPNYPYRIMQDMWFAPRVGVIKEVLIRFAKKQALAKETKILEKIVNP